MNPKQKIFALLMAVGIFIFIIDLVRKRKLAEEYSILWLVTGITIAVLVVWYDALEWLTNLTGAVAATTTLFIFGIVFLLAVNLHFSVKITRLTSQVKELAQKIAIDEDKN